MYTYMIVNIYVCKYVANYFRAHPFSSACMHSIISILDISVSCTKEHGYVLSYFIEDYFFIYFYFLLFSRNYELCTRNIGNDDVFALHLKGIHTNVVSYTRRANYATLCMSRSDFPLYDGSTV